MKKISIIITLVTALVLPIQKINAYTSDYEYLSLAGVACQPANLGQAVNLNATWSQTRIYNPNPTFGSSFYTVCPLAWAGGTSTYNGGANDVYVWIYRAPGAAAVTCTGFRYDNTNPNASLVKTVSKTTTSSGTGVLLELTNLFDNNTSPSDALADWGVVLCALPGQTGVNSVHFDYDA